MLLYIACSESWKEIIWIIGQILLFDTNIVWNTEKETLNTKMSTKENPRMKEDVTQILRFAKSRRRQDGENTGRYILSILHLHVYVYSNL